MADEENSHLPTGGRGAFGRMLQFNRGRNGGDSRLGWGKGSRDSTRAPPEAAAGDPELDRCARCCSRRRFARPDMRGMVYAGRQRQHLTHQRVRWRGRRSRKCSHSCHGDDPLADPRSAPVRALGRRPGAGTVRAFLHRGAAA
jgi:hypothetical protein